MSCQKLQKINEPKKNYGGKPTTKFEYLNWEIEKNSLINYQKAIISLPF